jgi:hypothetical protein
MRAVTPGLAAVLLLSLWSCAGHDSENESAQMKELLPAQLGVLTRQDSIDSYDRETIFDYINGAGEVYRSYAFSEVVVARYAAAEGSDVLVELFDMGTQDDAFGVFSYAREREEAGIGGGFEHKGDVLCFWQNRYYACVAFDDPTQASEASLREMATALSEQLPRESVRPGLVAMLPAEGLVQFSERFFHLHQSLNYHYYLTRENALSLGPETDVVFARYEPGTTFLLIARYGTEANAGDALASFRSVYVPDAGDATTHRTENGKYVGSGQVDRHVVVVLDAESEQAANDLLEAVRESATESTY